MLRPRGTLAILFNQADGDFEPLLPEAFWEAYRAAAIEKPPEQTVRTGLWKTPFPGPFESLVEESFPNPIELDRAQILRAGCVVEHDRRAARHRSAPALLARLGELLPDGVYRHPLRTELYRTRPAQLGQPADAVRIGRRVRTQQLVQLPARLHRRPRTPSRGGR